MVVIDPDRPYDTPEGVETERNRIIDEIVAVVRAQGVDPERPAVETLVTVTTWREACFEFEHFTDEELAAALVRIHPQHGDLDERALVAALRRHRDHRQDVHHVWSNWWSPKPSKSALAREL